MSNQMPREINGLEKVSSPVQKNAINQNQTYCVDCFGEKWKLFDMFIQQFYVVFLEIFYVTEY